MSMSMSKSGGKHMSADAEDKFEEEFEGAGESIDDWEMDLGLKILKIEDKLQGPAGKANTPVHTMLTRKLVTYNVALEFLTDNAKAAALIGSQGGLQSIIAYLTKQAQADSTRDETSKYSNKIKETLSGVRLSKAIRTTGLLTTAIPAASFARTRPLTP
jgi:hypothetical protein